LAKPASQETGSQKGLAGPLGSLSVQLAELEWLQFAEGDQPPDGEQGHLTEDDEDHLGWGFALD
jgi:hypothetical protein